jgi:two-component system, NtrC family, response regulator HydG
MTRETTQNNSLPAEKPAHLAVLVVDDEPLIRWSLRQALMDRGHSVATAASGADAINEIAHAGHSFNVVILDYRLPDRQDLTLLEDVRRLSPESVVMMMTAFGDDNMRTGARERGALAVVDKPFQVANFVALVESSVAR